MESYQSGHRITWQTALHDIVTFMDDCPNFRCQGDLPLKAIITRRFPNIVKLLEESIMGNYSLLDLFKYIISEVDKQAANFHPKPAIIAEERLSWLFSMSGDDFADEHERASPCYWRKLVIALGMSSQRDILDRGQAPCFQYVDQMPLWDHFQQANQMVIYGRNDWTGMLMCIESRSAWDGVVDEEDYGQERQYGWGNDVVVPEWQAREMAVEEDN